ncbi:HAD family hydrolase [Amaricoccus macauensis]|uniref:sulfotransferase-like domain-containing protein n=1 Tax=Amaricoccus macauensis TaxID=57001 RepID=UPI003C797E14
MWSGPRNLSTAMMYAFAARGDCTVVDEPFYAAYLAETGLDHPMREEILACQPADPATVITGLLAPVETPIHYAKLMTHHMLEDFPLDWLGSVTNVFLIRHPARVIASYARKRERPTLADIGFAEQARLFDTLADRTGQAPTVIDSTAIRADPAASLSRLCRNAGIPTSDSMLRWPAGPKPYDGIWASHWYGAVHRSSRFEAAEGPLPELTGEYARLCARALPYYERLARYR